MKYKYLVQFISFCILCLSCKKQNIDNHISICHQDTTPYYINVPKFFPAIPNINLIKLTKAKVELGKKLYYEKRLSFNQQQSCASCHVQENSFSHTGINSLPHINLIYNTNFLWNGKIRNGLLSAMHFEVKDFFKTNPDNIKNEQYKPLFCKAFGTDEITQEKIAECLMQFISTLIVKDTKFYRYLKGEVILSSSEFNGLNIFTTEKGDCFHCHTLPLFTDNSFRNIGLDSVFNNNMGLYEITGNVNDIGKFKVPTLLNIALTPPYMHDGRFITLDQVIEFYNNGVKYSPTLDPIMSKNNRLVNGLQLTEEEKSDLKAFLLTLTDTSFVQNPNFK